jgi:hypothetical protein
VTLWLSGGGRKSSKDGAHDKALDQDHHFLFTTFSDFQGLAISF